MKVVIFFAIGLLFIVKGGSYFVKASTFIAGATGIPAVMIGATIVSIATTMPEILVSLTAVADGANDLGVGNAIGSVNCNLGLALAVSAFFLPSTVRKKDFFQKSLIMIGSILLLWLFSWDRSITKGEGAILFSFFLLFLFQNIRGMNQEKKEGEKNNTKLTASEKWKYGGLFVVGIAGVVIGAKILVYNATLLARMLNISEAVIGLTLVAVGTSLPEIVTSITSVLHKQGAISIGNILGANCINITLILSLASFLSKSQLEVSPQTVRLEIPVALTLAVVATLPACLKRRFMKWQGAALFIAYIWFLFQLI